jgi:peptide/nickel transport system ATP-binding protein
MSLLAIKNLKVTFHTNAGQVRAVDGVTLELKDAETLALVGETGCGKSTIAHSVLNLLPDSADVRGDIVYQEKNLLQMPEKALARLRGKDISLVMQNPSLALNPVYTIGHQMTEPLIVHKGLGRQAASLKAEGLLEKLRFRGPSNAMRAYPFEMSGGMKQRVLIGISVVLSPKVILADEPTKGLDDRLRKMVLEELSLVREMYRSSMIFISHDLNAARTISDRIAVMYAGEILESGATQKFFQEPLHPYSLALLGSLPERGFKPIPGFSPSVIQPPEGCKFHPRCPYKKDQCFTISPGFKKINNREVKCVLYN